MLSLLNVSMGQILFSSVGAWFIFAIFRALHNLYLHPLAKFPGPILRCAFHMPYQFETWTGNHVGNWHDLHRRYGEIVRVSPTQLSIINADAWKDIYGYGSRQPMQKCPDFYYQEAQFPYAITTAPDEVHTRMRRALNPAFSEQALRAQEGMIISYISLLISKLNSHAASGNAVDIMKYLNFTTFDITGDLTFDESFGSLESENYDSWIAIIFDWIRFGAYLRVLTFYGFPIQTFFKIIPALRQGLDTHRNYTGDKMERRLNKKTDRKDFLSYISKDSDERTITRDEMKETSGLLILAGSETSATLLSGAIYYLLKNPSWLKKLEHELRTAFANETEITFASTAQLKILNAVIQETFRLYPPVPGALPRVTPKGGALVAGTFIPGDITIGIPQYPASRSSHNFTDPDKYAPERFLGDDRYASDKRQVIQPFSTGPRNCIGQSLAWAEMRTILGRLVWNFEFQMLDTSKDWEKQQRVFVLWSKPSLMVRLRAREA
ncbi:cytochrome P450 monooxygenase-like protein [Phaeosphaeria sp. MPI-PUGE-AT-0046c]|nr:cytochrome P450 monooxygenase-like protein [Phaeosphaeria sp. MPI-PUGE-AT-0046c]